MNPLQQQKQIFSKMINFDLNFHFGRNISHTVFYNIVCVWCTNAIHGISSWTIYRSWSDRCHWTALSIIQRFVMNYQNRIESKYIYSKFKFPGTGMASVIISFLMSTYYSVIIAYAIYYFFSAFRPEMPWLDCAHRYFIHLNKFRFKLDIGFVLWII